jgi:hypothetical protein
MAFRGYYKGIGEMLTMPGMEAGMHRKAEKVMAEAEATAPVGRGRHPGRYRDSFSVSSGIRGSGRDRRAFGRVTNDAPEALFVEYGSIHNDRYRTLGRALDAATD